MPKQRTYLPMVIDTVIKIESQVYSVISKHIWKKKKKKKKKKKVVHILLSPVRVWLTEVHTPVQENMNNSTACIWLNDRY